MILSRQKKFGFAVLKKRTSRNLQKTLKISNLWLIEKNKKVGAVMVDDAGNVTPVTAY
tara:strand:+ start:2262 stop:2435 length:174 start_codon:yes stop_codon:yes gene_type:complete